MAQIHVPQFIELNYLDFSSEEGEFYKKDIYLFVGYYGNIGRYDLLGKYNKDTNSFSLSGVVYDETKYNDYLFGLYDETQDAINKKKSVKEFNESVNIIKTKTKLKSIESRGDGTQRSILALARHGSCETLVNPREKNMCRTYKRMLETINKEKKGGKKTRKIKHI
jgi:hypothetical protein